MAQCASCGMRLSALRVLLSRGVGRNFSRESGRYHLSCSHCHTRLVFSTGATRAFSLGWLLPLLPLTWIGTFLWPQSLIASAILVLVWTIGFPVIWLYRVVPEKAPGNSV